MHASRLQLVLLAACLTACGTPPAKSGSSVGLCPCPQSMWDELGLGGPEVVVPTDRPPTREAAITELRACEAGLETLRANLGKTERGARKQKDALVLLVVRTHSSRAFALGRRVKDDAQKLEATDVDRASIDRVAVDCGLVATLAHDVRYMIAIDCGCGVAATTMSATPAIPPPATARR
jgi:hypothetical protein